MAFSTAEGRAQILGDFGTAIDEIALASACLSEAYEQLDPTTADRLEDELYRPVQRALGRAKRTQAGFAERIGHDLPVSELAEPSLRRLTVKEMIQRAVTATSDAGRQIAELQDTMLPIEVGDGELRAGLAEVRELLGVLSERAPQFLRGLGR